MASSIPDRTTAQALKILAQMLVLMRRAHRLAWHSAFQSTWRFEDSPEGSIARLKDMLLTTEIERMVHLAADLLPGHVEDYGLQDDEALPGDPAGEPTDRDPALQALREAELLLHQERLTGFPPGITTLQIRLIDTLRDWE